VIRIPATSLPSEGRSLSLALEEYFAFDRLVEWRRAGDTIEVDLVAPHDADYYIDPQLMAHLADWTPPVEVTDIPDVRIRRRTYGIGMNDGWTVWSWSCWLTRRHRSGDDPRSIIVLHVDDHEDLMCPRVAIDDDRRLVDLITGQVVDLEQPESVEAALKSGAIGMGSFFAPLMHHVPDVHIRHLRANQPPIPVQPLGLTTEEDQLLVPDAARIKPVRGSRATGPGTYLRTSDVTLWADAPPDAPALLHLDLDYFNNRYNGDSHWDQDDGPRHDPDIVTVCSMVDAIFDALGNSGAVRSIEDVFIGVSPGFFPSELWAPTIERIERHLVEADL
jgi:hypothetical protein